MRQLERSGEDFPEDVTRIQRILRHAGYQCSRKQALEIWSDYSDSRYAGWMSLPDDDEAVLEACQSQIVN